MHTLPDLTEVERTRFEARINKTEACWTWTGSTNKKGYGRYCLNRRAEGTKVTYQAHRASYELVKGPIPEGAVLDHLCKNRCCVNPAHLEPVTEHENILRGDSPSAVNAKKTHCPKGHPYDHVINTGKGKSRRRCSVCNKAASMKYRASQKAKQDAPVAQLDRARIS